MDSKKFREEPVARAYIHDINLTKLNEKLTKAISNRNAEEVYKLSNKLGINYDIENDPIFELYQEGKLWTEEKNKRMSDSIDDKVLSKDERINEFLTKGKEFYKSNIFDYTDSEFVSLKQAKLLAKYFPGQFDSNKPLKSQSDTNRKTIFDTRRSSYTNVHVTFNKVYESYLKSNKK